MVAMRLKPQDVHGHHLRDFPASLVFLPPTHVLRHEEVERTSRLEGLPFRVGQIVLVKKRVLAADEPLLTAGEFAEDLARPERCACRTVAGSSRRRRAA